MSSLKKGSEELEGAWHSLRSQWRSSMSNWQDPVSRGFERDFWPDFEAIVPATIQEMQKLARLIEQMRQNIR